MLQDMNRMSDTIKNNLSSELDYRWKVIFVCEI